MTSHRPTAPGTRTAIRIVSAALGGMACLATAGAGADEGYRDGQYDGSAVSAFYGNVQVELEIEGGRIVDARILERPTDSKTSRTINRRALPDLESELIAAQSADIDVVSGATLTSEAFIRSAGDALRQAGG